MYLSTLRNESSGLSLVSFMMFLLLTASGISSLHFVLTSCCFCSSCLERENFGVSLEEGDFLIPQ